MQKDTDTRVDSPTLTEAERATAPTDTNGSAHVSPVYWYETQERAFAPGIADGWPTVIKAPHTRNGRLVRRPGDPSKLLAALKALADDYEALMGDGMTETTQPAVLRDARAALAKADGRA